MNERYAYIQKKDIQALLNYEKQVGIKFNQLPNQQFIDRLSNELKLPIINVFFQEHNIIRAVVINPFDFKTPVLVDMTQEMFSKLPRIEVDVDEPRNENE